MQHYKDNEVAADRDYKGERLVVLGKIDSIGKDILGRPYVALKTNDLIGSVQFMFGKQDEARLSGLAKGSTIYIGGLCKGKLMNILFEDSEIID